MRQFCIGLMLLVAAFSQADAEPKVPHTVKSGGSYYFALPAKQIAYGAAAKVTSSDDGRYLAYILDTQLNRDPGTDLEINNFDFVGSPAPSRGLWIYDRSTAQAEFILALNNPTVSLESIDWLEGSSHLAISLDSDEESITTIYNAQTKRSINLKSNVSNADHQLSAVRKQNSFVLISDEYSDGGLINQYIEVYDVQFRFVRMHKIPSNLRLQFVVHEGNLIAHRFKRDTRTWESFEFNLHSGSLTPTDLPIGEGVRMTGLIVLPIGSTTLVLIDVEEADSLMRRLETTGVPTSVFGDPPPVSQGETAKPVSEVLKAAMILTTEGTRGEVVGKNQASWHVNRSGLFLTELMPLSASQYEQLLIQRIKQETMSRAKQVGTAMMIYGSDYDDALPMAQGWQEALYPYMKNNKLVEGFVYLMNGEVLTEIEDISGTVIGFIETQYGTAYVRADSSVVWKDKPKPVAYLRSLEALRT